MSTEFHGDGMGTFIEVGVTVENDYNRWERYYHFHEFDEVVALFKRQDYEFFAHGDCDVAKCADPAEMIAIQDAYEHWGAIALRRNQLESTVEAVKKGLATSTDWLQFYNDVLAQTPDILELVEFHTTNVSYCGTTIKQLEDDINELTAAK